jgi:teichuronic acid biosynthesis glycosyltransferase TuaH
MKLVFLSHTAMGGPFVVGSHHLAQALSRAGHDVSHVSAAISPAHVGLALKDPFVRERCRRWLRGGRRFGNVTDLVPFTLLPWALARSSPRLMSAYSRSMLVTPTQTITAAGIYRADYLIVDDPRFVGVTESRGGARVVYRATDLYAAMRNDSKILDAERSICASAWLLVATSVRVAEHLQRLSGKKAHVVANGVDFEHFTQTASVPVGSELALPGRQEDRAVYVGAFDQRFGAEALKKAATKLPDKTFILIGPGANEFAGSLHMDNVVSLGPIRYEVLPQILQRCSVGMLPMSSHASNDGRSPMKFYEYAAAGLCVAASTSHELRRRKLPTLFLAGSDDAFPSTVLQAFDNSKHGERRTDARLIAKAESWQGKAELLLKLMRSEAGPESSDDVPHEGFAGQSAVTRSRVN